MYYFILKCIKFFNTFLIKQDNEWYYLSHDMGGSQLTKVVGMIEWIDKEYKIKTRENKLKRINASK